MLLNLLAAAANAATQVTQQSPMSDAVLVAIISTGGAIIISILSTFWNNKKSLDKIKNDVDSIKRDVTKIKETLIPNVENRVSQVENTVQMSRVVTKLKADIVREIIKSLAEDGLINQVHSVDFAKKPAITAAELLKKTRVSLGHYAINDTDEQNQSEEDNT